MLFKHAHPRIVQVLPKIRRWASSFLRASPLLPDPHVEQVPKSLNLHTSQLIPQAPVGIVIIPQGYERFLSETQRFPFLTLFAGEVNSIDWRYRRLIEMEPLIKR